MHTFDSILPPFSDIDTTHHQEPRPVKKFLKDDGTFLTQNIIIGWLIDTAALTIELLLHGIVCLNKIIWQRGTMVPEIPDGCGLFSALQVAFKQLADRGRIRLTGRFTTSL
jgi:hypothetical protein